MSSRAHAPEELKAILLQHAHNLTGHIAIPPCPLGGPHIVRLSYGATRRRSVGLFSLICCIDQGTKCDLHLTLAPTQMTDEARMQCMLQIVQLPFVPYGDPAFITFCHGEYLRLAAKLGVVPALPHLLPPFDPVTIGQATPKRSPGRPRDPRVTVLVLFYIQNADRPLNIEAEGILKDNLVHFKPGQAAIRDLLKASGIYKKRMAVELWTEDVEDWTSTRLNQDIHLLLPGQGRLFRLPGVHALNDFPTLRNRVRPDAYRLNHPATATNTHISAALTPSTSRLRRFEDVFPYASDAHRPSSSQPASSPVGPSRTVKRRASAAVTTSNSKKRLVEGAAGQAVPSRLSPEVIEISSDEELQDTKGKSKATAIEISSDEDNVIDLTGDDSDEEFWKA